MTLIQRLEQAAEGSRELDAEIAEYVGIKHRTHRSSTGHSKGREWMVDTESGGIEIWSRSPPAFTTSLDAALTISPPNCTRAYGNLNENDCAWACITPHEEPYPDYTGEAATEALAFCIAALKAHDDIRARSSDR